MSVWSTDHVVIGRRFFWLAVAGLVLGGLLALAIRWQLAWPSHPLPLLGPVTPYSYQALFTMHGLVMVFFGITPLLFGGLGNAVLPSLIGADALVFPRLTRASFFLYLVALGFLVASLFTQLGTATAGWTMYPPLSTPVGTPGRGQTLVVVGIVLAVSATLLTAVNHVTTVLRARAPGLSFLRLPLTAWGLFLAQVLNVLFVPVVAAATLLLLSDRVLGTRILVAGAQPGATGDPLLFQHLFWLFGHPEVYILILPVWGVIGDFLAFFSRKPAFFYRGTVGAMVTVATLSSLVYGHHMFVSGLGPLPGRIFMALTLVITLPAQVLFINWMVTLWRGSIRLDPPMLFALGALVTFGVGGLSGVYLGAVVTDIYLHDTMFVVGHFHLTMAAAALLGCFAAVHFWFPKLTGRSLTRRLALAHFWSTTLLLLVVFGGQLLAGYAGQQRRLFDPYAYEFLQPLLPLNRWIGVATILLLAVQLLFAVNVVRALWRGTPAPANPWGVGTLDWTRAPGALVRVVRGPHHLSHPETSAALGRDWVGQAEDVHG